MRLDNCAVSRVPQIRPDKPVLESPCRKDADLPARLRVNVLYPGRAASCFNDGVDGLFDQGRSSYGAH